MMELTLEALGLGIIGCGNISSTYLAMAPKFRGIEIRAVADIDLAAAMAKSEQFQVRCETVEGLLSSDDIQIVVNLTVPAAHFEVSRSILASGKHVYSEKPLALRLNECLELGKLANEKGLRVGSAPDTWLGGSHQAARAAIDNLEAGEIISGTAHVLSHGMEHWHPNPEFFYQPGGGPVLDLGPYYIANLIQLLGPVERVAALTTTPSETRMISAEPRNSETFAVGTPTNIHALLQFKGGAAVAFSASWDVWAHRHSNMELYGTEGTIFVPDPNFFGGPVEIVRPGMDLETEFDCSHPFSVPNDGTGPEGRANYRGAGVAEMAQAILKGKPHRCSLELATHSVDVMTSILKAGEIGEFVNLATECERPRMLAAEDAQQLLSIGAP